MSKTRESLVLFNVCGALCLALFGFARVGIPRAQAGYVPKITELTDEEVQKFDPKLSSVAKNVPRQLAPDQKWIVMAIESCKECNVSKLQALNDAPIPRQIGRAAVIFEKVDPNKVQLFQNQFKNVKFVPANGKPPAHWNVAFYPRVYGFGKGSTFIFLQLPTDSYTDAILMAAKALQ